MLNAFAERISAACTGLVELKTNGKLPAVFGIALLWLVLAWKKQSGTGRRLTGYGLASALLCTFPVTAALLMCYQTSFYDYRWLWAYVPMTAVCAYGGVLGAERLSGFARRKAVCAGIAVCAALYLCSGTGSDTWGREQESSDYTAAQQVMTELRESFLGQQAEEPIVLWAPEEILQYARALDGSVQLLYGRNMTDNALNAYAYDTCGEELTELQQWMDEEPADVREETASRVEQAFALGANCLLLDDEISEEALAELGSHAQWRVTALSGYWLIQNTGEIS